MPCFCCCVGGRSSARQKSVSGPQEGAQLLLSRVSEADLWPSPEVAPAWTGAPVLNR